MRVVNENSIRLEVTPELANHVIIPGHASDGRIVAALLTSLVKSRRRLQVLEVTPDLIRTVVDLELAGRTVIADRVGETDAGAGASTRPTVCGPAERAAGPEDGAGQSAGATRPDVSGRPQVRLGGAVGPAHHPGR
jgi:hypothetical protein